ncbi:fimbria/pilus outer membrane usher protein [Burkholderia alba]|uniref:fimbria/pilus outer membrane usher protein n=1 Tax=Burkholderia alba TaxID=2683677 RepID=UPI002B053826|nr:fimbria/pilus outer membrane usher protein [Burkholderia alba]
MLASHWPVTVLAGDASDALSVADVKFNDQFLMRPKGQRVDVSRFARGNPVMPGEYLVDLYLNGDWIGRNAVRFEGPNGAAVPCFGQSLAEKLNLDDNVLGESSRAALARLAAGACANLGEVAPGASWSFELSDLRLDLSVPQALLRRTPQGYVSPEFWDKGVPSATLAYNFNTFHTGGAASNTTTYLGVDSGVNLGSWHVRQRSALTWQSTGPRSYQNIATYLQHDIPSLRSQLTIGDAFTDGAVFDSIGIRGVQLVSDDRMLPDSMRGYAPLIRGIAQSNARVTVSQNGNKLYETTVAPGPFEIKDLYSTGYGGNLLVTVTEADGSEHSFAVPYASVAQLLRPGITRFSVAAGEARDAQLSRKDKLVQGVVQRGVNNVVTGYAGAIAAEGYLAGLIGAAFNTPLGAVAVDVTQAKADIRGAAGTSGHSVRISYSKFVPSTQTNLAVAAYRYSSSGFWQMRDALLARSRVAEGQDVRTVDRQRNQVQLTLNQRFGGRWGNVYVVGSSLDYWNRGGTTTQFQVGYNNVLNAFGNTLTYTLSASRQRDGLSGQMNNQIFASVSLPLGRGAHAPTLAFGVTNNSVGGTSEQMMLNGSAFDDNALSYGVNVNRSPGTTTGGGNAQYRGTYATVSGSASGGSGFSQYSAGLSGAVVAHPGGVTLANDLGETIGIVEAKDAKGARITNAPGVHVDARGYAVIPYLTPYSLNTVELDPKGLPLDVELKATSAQIAPRANSVVMIRFATVSGRSAVISARQPDGAPLPFGATVVNDRGVDVGAVGQGGRIFVRGVGDAGALQVKWGDGANERCLFDYRLPPKHDKALSYVQIETVCRAAGIAAAVPDAAPGGDYRAPLATPAAQLPVARDRL